MSLKKTHVLVCSVGLCLVLAGGCSSGPGQPASRQQAAEGGTPAAHVPCTPDRPVSLIPWAAPTPFHQGLCTSSQTHAYHEGVRKNDVHEFRAVPANQDCLSCIETDVDASLHGPVITVGAGDLLQVLDVNYGGCVANVDGHRSSTSCGRILETYNNCALQECGDCFDYTEGGSHVKACLSAAVAPGGKCANTFDMTCQDELTHAASMCTNLDDFLYTWCGAS